MNNPGKLRYPELADELPGLPGNFQFDENEPQSTKKRRSGNEPFKGNWDQEHWRYYRWSYYRHIEHLDAEIGRILSALEDRGYINDTLIVMTSDHGEGMGHHQMVRKSSFYDEAARVPLLLSWPGHIVEDKTDEVHLASGLDVMPTLCDYAGIKSPASMRGVSLRPILEGGDSAPRDCVVSEGNTNTGRMLRTQGFKYIKYVDDPVEQLFDMINDPGETRNLAANSRYAAAMSEHRKLLAGHEARLDAPRDIPHTEFWRTRA